MKAKEKAMKIALWSDYACPYCYIGEQRLQKALRALGILESTQIIWKSFELDPTASRTVISTTVERFAQKYGLSQAGAEANIAQISELGRQEGLDFRYATTRYTNTFDALRLTKYAQANGKDQIIDKLFAAYFTQNLELADHEVLVKIACECGLDQDRAREILQSDAYASEVRQDEHEAAMLGIHGVPFFVINDRHTISGARPTDMLTKNLEEILQHEQANPEDNQGFSCGINGCSI